MQFNKKILILSSAILLIIIGGLVYLLVIKKQIIDVSPSLREKTLEEKLQETTASGGQTVNISEDVIKSLTAPSQGEVLEDILKRLTAPEQN